jgi:hypothetical protein
MYLLWYTEAVEVGNQRFCHCRNLSTGNGVGFQPLRKIIHSDHEVMVFLFAPWERPCYIDGYPFERGPDIVLMQCPRFLVLGPWLAARCHTAGTTSQHRFLPGASRTFVGPYWGSWLTPTWPPDGLACSLISTSFTLLRRRTTCAISDHLSADSQWRSSMPFVSARFLLGPVAFVCVAAVGDFVVAKGHWHCYVFGPDSARRWSCTLPSAESSVLFVHLGS